MQPVLTHEQQALVLGLLIVGGFSVGTNPKMWRLLQQLTPSLPAFRWRRPVGIFLGREFIPDQARLRHTQILGATGTGKTVLLEHLLFADLARGCGAIIIDPKGERAFYERIQAYCRSIGREKDLLLFSATYPDESAAWNPCALGNESELQTKFLNSAVYNEPFYEKACEYALGRAFRELKGERDRFDLGHLCEKVNAIATEEKKDVLRGLFYDL